MHVPNIKAISWDIFEHAEVIRPMLHFECDRLRRLQHLHVHLFRRLILHIHRVVLKDKRWGAWGEREKKKHRWQVSFTSGKKKNLTNSEWRAKKFECLRSSVISFAVLVKVPLGYISSKLSALLKCRSIDLCHVWGKKTNKMGDWRTGWCCAAWWQSCVAIQIAGPLWRKAKWEHARNCLLWVCGALDRSAAWSETENADGGRSMRNNDRQERNASAFWQCSSLQ